MKIKAKLVESIMHSLSKEKTIKNKMLIDYIEKQTNNTKLTILIDYIEKSISNASNGISDIKSPIRSPIIWNNPTILPGDLPRFLRDSHSDIYDAGFREYDKSIKDILRNKNKKHSKENLEKLNPLIDYPAPPYLHLINNLSKIVNIKELGDNNAAVLYSSSKVLRQSFSEFSEINYPLQNKLCVPINGPKFGLSNYCKTDPDLSDKVVFEILQTSTFIHKSLENDNDKKNIILYIPDSNRNFAFDSLIKNCNLADEIILVFDDMLFETKYKKVKLEINKYFDVLYTRNIPLDKEINFLSDEDMKFLNEKSIKQLSDSRYQNKNAPKYIFESSYRNWWLSFSIFVVKVKK